MRIRSSCIAGLALLTSIALTTTGCGSSSGGSGSGQGTSPTGSATPERPARQVLAESIVDLGTATHGFAMKTEDAVVEGTADPAADKIRLVFTSPKAAAQGPRVEYLIVDDETWVKLDVGAAAEKVRMPALPRQWMRLDPAKLDDRTLYRGGDILGIEDIFAAMAEMKKTADRRYAGRVDLTKVKSSMLVSDEAVTQLGPAASSVPVTVGIDETGRLASVQIDVPARGSQPARTWTASFRDYEIPVNLVKPRPGEAVPAPDVVYRLLDL